ncbi:interferon gamma [Halichoeres trimaculatus]|uniref:interferon gamma n=1 Tax=Halichoeres trimaculatus TaxID=147232 RepID=UPI003D9E2BD1
MSSSCGSVCLLVFLGAALAFGSPVHTENLEQIYESVVNELGLKNSGISDHSPFQSVFTSINISCLRKEDFQLINFTLDVYQRIFSSILERSNDLETPTMLGHPQVKQHLLKLQQKMEEKKRHLSHLNHKKQDVLRDLHSIQVDDPVVQKKALASFGEVYKLADLMGTRCGPAH